MVTGTQVTDQAEGSQGLEVPRARAAFIAPLGSVTAARLVFSSGAARVSLAGDAPPAALYTAHFEQEIPGVTVRDGIIVVAYGRGRPLGEQGEFAGGRSAAPARVQLSSLIPWEIEFRAGVSWLTAELQNIHLRSLDLGSISQAHLRLPQPDRYVFVHLGGSASAVRILRPAGVAVQFTLYGSGTGLILDGKRAASTSDGLRWRSADYSDRVARYEITVSGSASRLTIGTA